MPFNLTDYSKPPYINGLMFDPATEEDLILYVQAELKKVAEEVGETTMCDAVIWTYNSYPDRWDKGEWINGDTANFCWSYQTEDIYEYPIEDPVEEPVIEETETEPPVEEPVAK